MSVLDDLKLIHYRDAQDALGIAQNQWKQLETTFQLDWKPAKKLNNIVLAGMGGSALAGLLSTTWPDYSVPFEICRTYDIPAYVDEHTLFIASSYSGNTEETLAALQAAESKGATIICMSSGGKLQQLAEKHNHPFVLLPKASQPRFAVLSGLKAYVMVLEQSGFVKTEAAEKTLQASAIFLRDAVSAWMPEVPTSQNPAKQLALELMGKSVVVYAGPKLFPAAYKWKISFNENAKNIAWCGQLPEFNHNEFLGWTSHPEKKPYAVVDLRSDREHPRVQKRFEVTERLLSGKRPSPEVVVVQGEDDLQQLLWAVVFGDFVSLYLAILNGINPTPVEAIEKFKRALDN